HVVAGFPARGTQGRTGTRLPPLALHPIQPLSRHAGQARPRNGAVPRGSCRGMAFRAPASKAKEVVDTLWKREMLNNVYTPKFVPVTVAGAQQGTHRVHALAFIADTKHRQFVDELDVAGRARLVAQGVGQRGRCVDYIRNTLEHMRELGVHDPHLTRILETALDLSTGATDK